MKDKQKLVLVLITSLVGGLLMGYALGSKKGASTTETFSLAKPGDGACSAGTPVSTDGGLFELDGRVYKASDFSSAVKSRYFAVKSESFQKESGLVEELALTLALAKNKGMKVDLKNPPKMQELLPAPKVTDEEVVKFFNENKGRLPPNVKFDAVKGQIRKYLANQGMGKVFIAELATLKKDGRYKTFLVKPIAPEVSINVEGYPSMGSKDAKFTLVEASDYTCGHCKSVHPEVKKVLKKYGNKIKFVQMNFSLQPHGLSGKLIKGAYCAQKQSVDKFWKYHNLAFEHNFETKDFNTDGIAKLAKLDKKKFDACLKDQASDDFVHATNETLSNAGVHSTPSFFLNNKKLVTHGKSLEQAVAEAIGI